MTRQRRNYASGCRQDTDPAVRPSTVSAGAEIAAATASEVPPLKGGPGDHDSEATHGFHDSRQVDWGRFNPVRTDLATKRSREPRDVHPGFRRSGSPLMAACPKAACLGGKALRHSVYDQPDAAAVQARFDKLLDTVAESLPMVQDHLDTPPARLDLGLSVRGAHRDCASAHGTVRGARIQHGCGRVPLERPIVDLAGEDRFHLGRYANKPGQRNRSVGWAVSPVVDAK